ncbi:LytR family transcriptional regulator [Nocardia yunnanensis]|uniref:LytR family transcriptional regulator n=1 Tax=Nocardia yunnanensis TaxID=2382165 RepID=A0A386Z5Z3_9NOCA|nr:LCP family protein [Nocardia yunnanensis]AYF72653.1 LytR family transcriptional regulator [Nocardia yunnanensis]
MPSSRRTRALATPGRVLTAVLAVLVLVVTGLGWHSVDRLVSGIERIGNLGLGGNNADGATDILMVGIDSRTDAHGNPLTPDELAMLHAGDDGEGGLNTDTIVLIRVPNDGSSATAISIPRDSYVQIPGLGMGKINSAYGVTKATTAQKLIDKGVSSADADRQSTLAGRQALVKTVANLTGITVDHYAEVGLLGFVLLTDAVGGVDVCLNNPVNEPLSGADFPAGPQKLDGAAALSFVRQRHDLPRGDLDRIVRQQVYMAQLVHQVLSAKVLTSPSRLQELSNAVGRTVVLDDGWDVLSFLHQLQDLSGGAVKFETIPVQDLNGWTDNGESVVRVDPPAVQKFVAKAVGDEEAGDGGVDPATVTVDVYNASGTAGLAGQAAQALAAKGFRTGTVDNWIGGPIQSSRVLAGSGGDPKARAVAAALGGLPVMGESGLPAGTVRVVLASDYAGPGSATGNGAFDFSGGPTTATPVPPAPPIDAGTNGPKCVN